MNFWPEISLINGVQVLSDQLHTDHRGYFNKLFYSDEVRGLKFSTLAIASNLKAGTIRGLHFQSGIYTEEKLIKCIKGSIFDVVVDLRHESPTFGHWSSIVLNESSEISLLLPNGIAHGYQTLEDNTQILYGISGNYNSENSHSIKFNDPNLSITWPLPGVNISARDLSGISFIEASQGFL